MKHETKGYMFAIESGIGVYVPFTGKVSVVEGADPKNEKTADKASTLLGLKVERADTSTEKWGRTVLRIDGAATTVTME